MTKINPNGGKLSRRAHTARIARRSGLLALLERWPARPGIFVLNHHRITHPDSCPYDHGVIDSTPEQFERQIRWLQSRFRMLTLREAEEAATAGSPLRDCGVLITFDDGYIDNYQVAFPILRSLGVQGTFFLATSYIGTARAPWWDSIAYRVRRSTCDRIQLRYPEPVDLPLSGDREETLRQLLLIYK